MGKGMLSDSETGSLVGIQEGKGNWRESAYQSSIRALRRPYRGIILVVPSSSITLSESHSLTAARVGEPCSRCGGKWDWFFAETFPLRNREAVLLVALWIRSLYYHICIRIEYGICFPERKDKNQVFLCSVHYRRLRVWVGVSTLWSTEQVAMMVCFVIWCQSDLPSSSSSYTSIQDPLVALVTMTPYHHLWIFTNSPGREKGQKLQYSSSSWHPSVFKSAQLSSTKVCLDTFCRWITSSVQFGRGWVITRCHV